MQPTRSFLLAATTLAALGPLACGCSKKLTAEAIEASPAAIVQKGPMGSSAWIVDPKGTVSATLKGPDGKPIAKTVTGQVTFAAPDGTPSSVPLQFDPASGVLTAAGPKLDADITPVSYALTVDGRPWTGSIDVPRGGTEDLVDTGKAQAGLPPPPPGPNGGVVQVVGPDRVELVASKSSGDVRAYVLGDDDKPVDPGDRKITVALQGEAPEVIVLAPEPQGHFVVGHLRTRIDPTHVTLAVSAHGRTHACLVGWAPGSVVVVGPSAPRVHLLAVEALPGEIEVRGRHGRGRGEFIVGGPGVVVDAPGIEVGAPGVIVGGPGFPAPGLPGPPGLPLPGVGLPLPGAGLPVPGPGVVRGPGVVVGAGHEHERGDHDRGDHDRGGRHGH